MVIITAIIGLIVGIAIAIYEEYFFVIFPIFCTVLGILLGVLLGTIISVVPGQKEVVDTISKPIYALQDNTFTSGRFFLISGYIDEELSYSYVYKTEDGGYKIDKVSTEKASVFYVENEKDCRIEYDEIKFANPIHDFLSNEMIEHSEYRIYIPEGSICSNYSIDLQ